MAKYNFTLVNNREKLQNTRFYAPSTRQYDVIGLIFFQTLEALLNYRFGKKKLKILSEKYK